MRVLAMPCIGAPSRRAASQCKGLSRLPVGSRNHGHAGGDMSRREARRSRTQAQRALFKADAGPERARASERGSATEQGGERVRERERAR